MTHTLDAPGATLSYEVLGTGPVLALIGHPMPADGFRALAAELAADHTVVLHDPRGTGASTMTDPTQPPDPDVLADDLSRVIAAVTDGPADVFGSSGGGITALALAAAHPEQVRTVVAHEPPLVEYLPDAEVHRANGAAVQQAYREQGLFAAMGLFAAQAGFAPDPDAPAPPPPSEGDQRAMTRLVLGLQTVTGYRVDGAALPAGRVSIGLGEHSGAALTGRTSTAVAEALGLPLVGFPGGHAGFAPEQGGDPAAFAAVLRSSLGG
ncbi:alpha/beta hydrolase fold [Klenkia soli]|uniref:Alpha/beta hydrolase fold n=1 Tax=Klenkia soli TaxID=1052260 RepID=A0A1H0Q778_9ACTN|nr:alpha/beta hydrolase [Klenkia soli]SDP12538.1 alpha/beta hydrolase fold [Klenkia soli]